MTSYKINRHEFVKLFDVDLVDKLWDYLMDHSSLCSTESFIINYDFELESIYIINKHTLQTISWYKYPHVGRALEMVNIGSKKDLIEFINLLREEISNG